MYVKKGHAAKLSWWDKAVSCGPVVEQATHFVDLIRFIAGEDNHVVEKTIKAISVEHDEQVGHLTKLSFDENSIEPQKRVPRITSALWKHKRVSDKVE